MTAAIRFVGASGDTSGATDHARFVAVLAELAAAKPANGQSLMVLADGPYYLNDVITVGTPGSINVAPVDVVSANGSRIKYTGSETTNYFWRIHGKNAFQATTRLMNISLDCDHKCRGLLLQIQTYGAQVRNVKVVKSLGVGIDVAGSYNIILNNVFTNASRGIAMRIYRCQGSTFDVINLSGYTGSDQVWPATDDESVIDPSTGAYIRTAEAERAALVIDTSAVVIRNFLAENNILGALPMIYMKPYTRGVSFKDTFYLEANQCDNEFVLIQGPTDTELYSQGGHTFAFENISKHDATACATFLRTKGLVDYVRIDGIRGHHHASGLSGLTNVIQCDGSGSKLYRAQVNGARAGVAASNQIASVNEGSIETGLPYGLTFAAEEIEVAP